LGKRARKFFAAVENEEVEEVNAPKTQQQLEAMRKRDRTSGDAEEIHDEEEEDEEDQEEDQEEEEEEEDNEGEDKASDEVESELPPKVKEGTKKKFKKRQSGKQKKRSLQVCEKPFFSNRGVSVLCQ
jgi:hypothetical protein